MHKNVAECLSCQANLERVHPDLLRFVTILRQTHPDAHISCGYRGKADQEDAFRTGHSRAHYGQSAHNTVPAQAVDVFRLTQPNGASWDPVWFKDVLAPIARSAGLIWGGDWQSFKDMPHVELPGFLPFNP